MVPVEATDDVEMPTRVKRAKVLVSVTNEKAMSKLSKLSDCSAL